MSRYIQLKNDNASGSVTIQLSLKSNIIKNIEEPEETNSYFPNQTSNRITIY